MGRNTLKVNIVDPFAWVVELEKESGKKCTAEEGFQKELGLMVKIDTKFQNWEHH